MKIILTPEDLGQSKEFRKIIITSFDFIVTDIVGVRSIRKYLGSHYDHQVECKLRVLDSFGTDEIFNAKNSTLQPNAWGKLGLNLKQFWTFYPHNKQGLSIMVFEVRGSGVTEPIQ